MVCTGPPQSAALSQRRGSSEVRAANDGPRSRDVNVWQQGQPWISVVTSDNVDGSTPHRVEGCVPGSGRTRVKRASPVRARVHPFLEGFVFLCLFIKSDPDTKKSTTAATKKQRLLKKKFNVSPQRTNGLEKKSSWRKECHQGLANGSLSRIKVRIEPDRPKLC